MTPCEEKGYKIGDTFKVMSNFTGGVSNKFNIGSIVTLVDDDGSLNPRFERVDYDGFGQWVYIEDVEKIESKPLTQQLSEAVAKRDKYGRKADKWAQRLADQAAEVSRIAGELEKEIEEATGCGCSINPDVRELENAIPADVDPDDPKTWREGDVVECVEGSELFTAGNSYVFSGELEDNEFAVMERDDEGDRFASYKAKFRFVRRPGEQ